MFPVSPTEILGSGLQFCRVQQQVFDLQHNFCHSTAIVALTRTGVHLVNNF